MRNLIRCTPITLLIAICMSLGSYPRASGAPGEISSGEVVKASPVHLDLSTFMPVEEIRPGMKGIGKTVFSGTRIDEFQVEIIGVLKNVSPRGDIILAKVTGGPLPLERTGVIAGMSGSPIYIQGRLIGALAYTMSIFQMDPIAGITPISEMLEEYERNKTDIEWGKGTLLKADNGSSASGKLEAGSPQAGSALLPQGANVSNRNRMFTFWNSLLDNWGLRLDFQNPTSPEEEADWDLDSLIQRLKSQFSGGAPMELYALGFPWVAAAGGPWINQDLMSQNWIGQTQGAPLQVFPYPATNPRALNLLSGQVASYSPNFIPIKTPLSISGIDERVLKEMAPLLDRFGIVPVQGGDVGGLDEASQIDKEADQLLPGSAVGVQLIRGDMNASGFGTVTYVNGKHLIAFGHPMFGAGKVDIPMTTAYVHTIMANQINSFKMASPLSMKGSIRQDRRSGITGVLGSYPRMVPVKVIVESEKDHRRNEYNFEIINDDFFAPLFVRISCLNAIFASEKEIGDATVKLHAEVHLKDKSALVQKNIFSGDGASLLASLASVKPVGVLMNNPFEDVEVEKILITLSVAEKLEVAQIEGVRVSKDMLKPGESTQLTVLIQPFHGELITEKVDVTIPESVPGGELKLMACDSRIANAFEKFRAPLNFEPQNLMQLIKLLETEEQNNEIIVQLLHPKAGVTIKGREFASPPLSLLAIMNSSRHGGEGGLTRGTILSRQRIPTDYVVSGCELLSINVEDKYGMDPDEPAGVKGKEQKEQKEQKAPNSKI